ncbi:MAG: YczE/YyaS/YitT family protein [Cellulosimicrobium cellulans]
MVTTAGGGRVGHVPRTRRLVQLFAGLVAYAFSTAMLVHAGTGSRPWDVLHEGLARVTGVSIGTAAAATSVLVMALWWPLRERPGSGTIVNVVVTGVSVDPSLALLDALAPVPSAGQRVALAVGGVVLNGVTTAAYLGVRLGAGPRDGLMTGLVRRTGVGVGVVKTVLEVAVVAVGWLLGGTLGWSTLAYAFGVGVVVQACTRVLDLGPAGRRWWRRGAVVSPPRAPTPRRAGAPPAPAPRAGART